MRRLGTLVAAAVALAAAFSAGAAEGDLVVDVTAEQKTVKLGEDAVLLVTLSNHTASAMPVPALRLARDSVSVRVSWPGGAPQTVTRLYGAFLPNDAGKLEFRPSPTPLHKLGGGESTQARIAVPAVLAGPLTFTVVVGEGTPLRSEAKPVTVDVQGRQHAAAQVETTKGGFRIDLDAAGSYAGVANFWTLARDGFFDDLDFHRVLAGVLAQTGDPRGTGSGGPGWYLPSGTAVDAAARGDVGLARGAHPDSAGSQWFVVADPRGALSGGYVRLGTVTDGLDVVDRLAANAPDARGARPATPDSVVSVRTVLH